MSDVFIIKYAGSPMKLRGGKIDLVAADQASTFISKSDAYFEVYRHDLAPHLCDVVPQSSELSTEPTLNP